MTGSERGGVTYTVAVAIGGRAWVYIHTNSNVNGGKPRFELVTGALVVFLDALQGLDGTWCVSIGTPDSDHEFQVYDNGEVVGHTGA